MFPEGDDVNLGNTLCVGNTNREPSVQFAGAAAEKMYTIGKDIVKTIDDCLLDVVAMVDPDAPSRENPSAAQWNHWLVTNVDGKDPLPN